MSSSEVGSEHSTASTPRNKLLRDLAPLAALALATVVAHAVTGNRFGFHRDELATLADARHLAWGYVAYPPLTPFFGRLSLMLFGESVAGFRFFASLAEAVAVVFTGLMAREMGGGRWAQMFAGAAAVPFCLVGGSTMQYVSFDYLFWVLTAYFVVRMLRTEDPRWWLGIAAAVGLGLMAKYTMVLFALSLIVGMLLTPARRYLTGRGAARWFWTGVAVTVLIALPNFVWQARHRFITLDFLKHIHARDVRIGRARDFLPDQLKLTLLAAPLWAAGLVWLFTRWGRRYRPVAWMYLIPLVALDLAKGRGYYLAAGYPMLYAAGAVCAQAWLGRLRPLWVGALQGLAWTALAADIALAGFLSLPFGPASSPSSKAAMKINGDLREEVGWTDLVWTVAQIRDSVPAADRAHLGILAGNYGEAGALDLYGPRYGLPPVIAGVNSFWQRGYGDPPPETLIVVGWSRDDLDQEFKSCTLVAHSWNQFGVENEETKDHPDMFVCRGMKRPWAEFWKENRYYG